MNFLYMIQYKKPPTLSEAFFVHAQKIIEAFNVEIINKKKINVEHSEECPTYQN